MCTIYTIITKEEIFIQSTWWQSILVMTYNHNMLAMTVDVGTHAATILKSSSVILEASTTLVNFL
jgi:hypothetical protein